MYWFWMFIMASQPYLLLLGMLGVFGEEGKKAADDLALGIGVMLVVVVIVVAVFLALRATGLVVEIRP